MKEKLHKLIKSQERTQDFASSVVDLIQKFVSVESKYFPIIQNK